MSIEFFGCAFIILTGVAFAISFSIQTLSEAIALQGVPTPVEYLVRRDPFVLGKIVFVLFSLSIYGFALIFYRQLPQLAEFIPDATKDSIKDVLKAVSPSDPSASDAAEKSSSLLVVVFAITTTFLYAIRTCFTGNIIFAFRSLVHSWIAVPVACKYASEQLLVSLTVPITHRQKLSLDSRLHVDEADFESDDETKRQWAELAYMNWWAQDQKEKSQGPKVFSESDFKFEQLEREFIALRELTRLCQSWTQDDEAYRAMQALLDELRSKYARFVACVLMNLASSRVDFYDRCREVGINVGNPEVGNPLKYSALYVVTLAAAIIVGPYLFAAGYDLSQGKGLQEALTGQTFVYFWRWFIAGLAFYFSPIFAVLLVRYLLWRKSRTREQVSLTIYAWIFLGVLCVSLVGAILTALSFRLGSPSNWSWDTVGEAARRNIPWTIAPALTAVYINYYLDRQADPSKDDIDQRKETVIPRLLMALAYTFGIALLSMVIVAYQQSSENIWPRPETQLIVVGTTALVNLSLCFVAQFGLRKPGGKRPSPPSVAAAFPVVGGGEVAGGG
jgi:hypothetical protein